MIVIVALLMLYFILASQFRSLTLPLIVLIEIPIDLAMTYLLALLDFVGISLESDVDDRYRGHEWYRDQRLGPEDRYDHPASTTGISFAGSHSTKVGVRQLKPILMTSLTTIFCFDPFLWGRRYRFPITADAGGSYDQRGLTIGTLVSLVLRYLCVIIIWLEKRRIDDGNIYAVGVLFLSL